MNNKIGRIIEVSNSVIRVEIEDLKNLHYNHNGNSYSSKGINEYISIDGKFGDVFIYQTVRAEDNEKLLSQTENSKIKNSGIFTCIPIGIISNSEIKFNLYYYPFLNDEVYLTTFEQLDTIFSSHTLDKGIIFGNTLDGFMPSIGLEEYLTRHTAVLGNTGSGKSTTIRKSLEEVSRLNPSNVCFHILDIHGEYEPIGEINYKKFEIQNDYKILIKSLNLDDWNNLFKPSEQVQYPILQLSLKLANLISTYPWFREWMYLYLSYSLFTKVQTDVVGKRSKIGKLITAHNRISSNPINIANYSVQYGNFPNEQAQNNFLDCLKSGMSILWKDSGNYPESSFNHLIDLSDYSADTFNQLFEALEFSYLVEEAKGNSQSRAYSASLETRIKTTSIRYKSLFTSDEKEVQDTTPDRFIIYNVESLDDDLLLFFTSYLIKNQFEAQQSISPDDRKIHVFLLEEAHRYISKNLEITSQQQLNLFKRVAREGRKFGCFIHISSQRPSELSSTVLSQCNNFIIHRVKNSRDLEYISSTIPYLTKNQTDRISYLPTGTALFVGDLFPIPLEISVSDSKLFNDTKSPLIKYR